MWENAQPTFCSTAAGSCLALGHNGNLVNTAELLDRACQVGAPTRNGATTDSDLIAGLLATAAADTSIEKAAQRLLPQLRGAFSLVFCDESTLCPVSGPCLTAVGADVVVDMDRDDCPAEPRG